MIKTPGGGFDHIVDLTAPAGIVFRLWHHLTVTQRIKKADQARLRTQVFGGKPGKVDQRGIEQRQILAAIKHRKAGGQVGKGFGQRLDKFTLNGFGADDAGNVRGIMQGTRIRADGLEVIPEV